MSTVYTVAFSGQHFLMVYNPKRNGWEMPGGKMKDHENVTEAAVREYIEESGHDIEVIARKELTGCHVCVALLGRKITEGEMMFRLFSELPDDLAFGRSEYDGVLEWARSSLGE